MDDQNIVMASEIVAAFVTRNHVSPDALPELLVSVADTLRRLQQGEASVSPEPAKTLTLAVPPRKSVTDEYLISLETGQKLRSLKRHLTALGMTPDDYRKKWGLSRDYPMVAPAYSARRSALAKGSGLGRKIAAE